MIFDNRVGYQEGQLSVLNVAEEDTFSRHKNYVVDTLRSYQFRLQRALQSMPLSLTSKLLPGTKLRSPQANAAAESAVMDGDTMSSLVAEFSALKIASSQILYRMVGSIDDSGSIDASAQADDDVDNLFLYQELRLLGPLPALPRLPMFSVLQSLPPLTSLFDISPNLTLPFVPRSAIFRPNILDLPDLRNVPNHLYSRMASAMQNIAAAMATGLLLTDDEFDPDIQLTDSSDVEDFSSTRFRGLADLERVSILPSLATLASLRKSTTELLNRISVALHDAANDVAATVEHEVSLMADDVDTSPSGSDERVAANDLANPALALNQYLSTASPNFLAKPDLDFDEKSIMIAESDKVLSFHEGRLGCEHYECECKVQCVICEEWYVCRLCHDAKQDHKFPRRETKYMMCMNCFRPQPAARDCRFCNREMAYYYCDICKLWNDEASKQIYHCPDCGICRLGAGLGIDVFHCKQCGICMSISLEGDHKCIVQSTHSDCPICLEYMFDSTRPVVFMSCGHPLHSDCYQLYIRSNYRCPVCYKSIINTSALLRTIDEEVAAEVLPPHLQNLEVPIICCDCSAKTRTPFHLAGLKCLVCGSYNTTRL